MKRILILSALLTATAASARTSHTRTWASIQKEAQGQTVNFYMWGGPDDINRYVYKVVAPAARKAGVTLRRVPVSDTGSRIPCRPSTRCWARSRRASTRTAAWT